MTAAGPWTHGGLGGGPSEKAQSRCWVAKPAIGRAKQIRPILENGIMRALYYNAESPGGRPISPPEKYDSSQASGRRGELTRKFAGCDTQSDGVQREN